MQKSVVNYTDLSLRPVAEADYSFLQTLYYSTRERELKQIPLSDEQKQQFISMQFDAQQRHYQSQYPAASLDVILHQEEAIGRLYLDEWESEFRLVDIALLPAYYNQGIGSWLLKNIMQRASVAEKAVSLHVEQSNPALQLYQRLGFKEVGEQGVHRLMQWQAD